MLIGKDTFEGRGGHTLRGTFTLIRGADAVLMRTDAAVFFDGSPEPGWALLAGDPAKRGDAEMHAAALATRFGDMPGGIVEIAGCQTGTIIPAATLDDKDTLFLWCFYSPVLLGAGPIEFA